MLFDPNNNIVKLCAQGMTLEGDGKTEEASIIFLKAWNEASSDIEKFTAAHYVARHQNSVEDKLIWDERALNIAMKIKDKNIHSSLPSLYLNIAKCHEDLNNLELSRKNYRIALLYSNELPDTGYSQWVKGGILKGMERVNSTKNNFEK